MHIRRLTALAGLVGLIAALPVAAAPASAAARPSTASVADRLVLEPTERGYRGSLTVDLTYRGAEPGRASYVITEPIPGSYENVEWGISCNSSGDVLPDGRTRVECNVPGGELTSGERRSFTIDFTVLTPTRPYAMKAGAGRLAVKVDGTTVTDESFSTRFRSTTGSLADPQPYVRDRQPDLRVTAPDAVTLVRQPDGMFEGRLPVTLRYAGDAPHDSVWYAVERVPDGVWEPWTESCGINCVEGGAFMTGEERSLTLIVSAPADTPVGELGPVDIQFHLSRAIAADVDPGDNRITFTVSTVEAP
ncbi:hypothetical protein [Micromonospora sp. B006]|uniref:hypothetical protein n=1 Tax=Micromonospora sp. B006 TaxID=2201999 RepID=UPI000E30878A|nr:hypothetical protein [Micromonospora sp. B006]AXO34136.1 hypothetical protein MicB006_1846 [Micromonospora sp. B006]